MDMRIASIPILVTLAWVYEVASFPKGLFQDQFQFPPMELNDNLGKTPKEPDGVLCRESSSIPCPKFLFPGKTLSSSASTPPIPDSNEPGMSAGDKQRGTTTAFMTASKSEEFNFFLENSEQEGSPAGPMYVPLKADCFKPPSGRTILGDGDRTYPKKGKNEILRAWTKRPIPWSLNPDHKLLIPEEEVSKDFFHFKSRTAFLNQDSEKFRTSVGLMEGKEGDYITGKYGVKITRVPDHKDGNKSKTKYKVEGGIIRRFDNGNIWFEKTHPILKLPTKTHIHIKPRYKMVKWEQRENGSPDFITNHDFSENPNRRQGSHVKEPGKIIKHGDQSQLLPKKEIKILAGYTDLSRNNQRENGYKTIMDYILPPTPVLSEPSHKDFRELRKHVVGRIMFLDLVQGIEMQTQPPHKIRLISSAKKKIEPKGSNSKMRVGRINYVDPESPIFFKRPNVEDKRQDLPYSFAPYSTGAPFPGPIPAESQIRSPPWKVFAPYIGVPST